MSVSIITKTAIGAGVAAAAAVAMTGPSAAKSIDCGQSYTISRGDTLSGIAQRAYGNRGGFQLIYSANAEAIGPNPNRINVGMALKIPCLDAPTKASTADDSKIRTAATTTALPAPDKRVIRILTATDWAPFLDQKQKQGGMLTEITNVAMSVADGKPKYKIDWINDWSAHLRPLIADHAYDMGIAWFRPNCDVIDKLGDGSKFRCNNLDWSEPLFEQVIGYYTRTGEPAPKAHKDLFGKKVCRPSGYSIFMLEEKDLVKPNVELLRPGTVAANFEMLADGRCDVVVLAVDVSEGEIEKQGLGEKVQANPSLAQIATLHAVIAKTHPQGKEILATLDSGLKKIKSDTRWFSIIRRHLAEHRAKTRK